MASIWTGTVSFGLVNIPVALNTAVREERINFRMLRKKDLCPVKYKRVCESKPAEEVPYDQIVKGYEYEKGRFVVLDEEDFANAAAALPDSKTFRIDAFVSEGEIEPRYYEKPYFLVPKPEGHKAYALLRDAMRETGTAALGTITMRGRQHFACIRVVGDALILDLMRYAAELVSAKEYYFPEAGEVRPQELKMAQQLVENLREEFDPSKYRDEYQVILQKIIAAKLKGKKLNLKEAEAPEATGVIDLMERLQASLKTGGSGGSTGKGGAKAKRTTAPRKKSSRKSA